ncbi:MAG TPA: hypothetical protein VHE14_07730 [Solirubrobacteraceae bacterium]|nr:hypothetical protein [Solirubrobacteraceae bacterium]
MPTTPQTKRSTQAKKAAATRARKRTTQATNSTAKPGRVENPLDQVQDITERAVLTYVGAALVARDAVVEAVGDIRDTYSSRESATRRLKRFERRGSTARTRLERDVRRTRTRVERELRKRRTQLTRTVKRNRTRVERDAKSVTSDLRRQSREVTAQVENVVTAGQSAVARATEGVVS